MPKTCEWEGCCRNQFSKGYCKDHWRIKYGKPIKKISDKKASQPKEYKKRKKINPISAKKKSEDAIYRIKRLAFLRDNPYCVLCKMLGIEGCTIIATDVHHTRGHGIFYLDETTWLAACRHGHEYERVNSKKAYKAKVTKTRIVPVEQIIMFKLKNNNNVN